MKTKEFTLYSKAFKHTEDMPEKYTLEGQNIIPSLNWENAPFDTKSFALIVDDPDNLQGMMCHWLIKNIPKDTTSIEEGSKPSGIEIENSFGKKNYVGPSTEYKTHRIFFRLYALNTEDFEANDMNHFYREVERHKLDEATLMGKITK